MADKSVPAGSRISGNTSPTHSVCRWRTQPEIHGASGHFPRSTGDVPNEAVRLCRQSVCNFIWRFPATSSKAHSSLSPNQLHEGFNLLRNFSAVGAEILL